MNIITKQIDTLLPASYNPRKDLTPEDKEYQKIKRSIEEFGYVEPIIYNVTTNTIVGGHQRAKVLKELGYTEVEVVEIEETPEREKALNMALNKIEGEKDMDELKDLMKELENGEIDMDLTGFDEWELEQLFTQYYVGDDIPEELEMETESDDGETAKKNILTFDGKKIDMTDEELMLLNSRYDTYVVEHKTSYGFIGDLLR